MTRKSFIRRVVLIGLVILLIDKTFLLSDQSVNPKDQSASNQTNGVCVNESKMSSVLIVGVLSSLVFSFVGILPSFFIRTDIDVEKFSKKLIILLFTLFFLFFFLIQILFQKIQVYSSVYWPLLLEV